MLAENAASPLAALIAPMTVSTFLEQCWGQTPVLPLTRLPRCTGLFSWAALSELLSTHRFEYPRIRMMRRGTVIEPKHYVDVRTDRRGNPYASQNASHVEALLQDGAMLHITSIGDAWPALQVFAAALEQDLAASVQVNVHAGYGGAPGFHTHWDGHDVFALQIEGAKHWRIFGNPEPAPLAVPPDQKSGAPTEAVWEGTMRQGDMLYLPRGYWHATEYVGEPSLHLTFAAQAPTGLDFLMWLRDRLTELAPMRRDIPIAAFDISSHGAELKAAHLMSLREIIANGLSIEIFDEFLVAYRQGLGKTNAISLQPS